jgi:hypothetical protein
MTDPKVLGRTGLLTTTLENIVIDGCMAMRKLFILFPVLAAFLLASCVGGRTEADPTKHPDWWERKQARKLTRDLNRD